MNVGLHQGSALSPFLFITVMDEVSKTARREDLWELLFADDLAIIAKSERELQERVSAWQACLERHGLRVNAGKTEVLVCSKDGEAEVTVKDVRNTALKQVKTFKYLGSVIQEKGGCQEEVKARVKAAWLKWRETKGVVCDRRIPRRVKIKIYKTVIRPVLMYGAETWALRKQEENLLVRTEMRMIRWIMGISLMDRCTNEEIRRCAGVVCIAEKLREARLRWLGHVERRDQDTWVQRVRREPVVGRRSRGRQKLRWSDVLKKDMEARGMELRDARDRKKWRKLTRAADP